MATLFLEQDYEGIPPDLLDDDEVETIPSGLDTMEPGHLLATFLGHIDIERCTPQDRIRVLRAQQRLASHVHAQMYRTMTMVVDDVDSEDALYIGPEKVAAAEVAAALHLTRHASETELGYALDMQRRLPRVWNALRTGEIDPRRAKVLVDGTVHLSMEVARDVVDAIIADAGSMTTGQIRHRLRRLCIDTNPDDAKDRYRKSAEERRIATEPDESGTANFFGINLPPDRLQAGMRRINRIAKGLRGDGETRTVDQLRADVFLDLIQGVGPAPRSGRGTVIVHTDLPTLAGLANRAGDLAGYGPVVGDIVRRVADNSPDAEWRFVIEDSETGQPVGGGIIRRRPNASQHRQVEARNPTCVHPGCRMPSVECDIDHRIPWAESHTTRTEDLAPLCRHHHTLRHGAGWTYEPQPDGDFVFTSAVGLRYTTSGRSP